MKFATWGVKESAQDFLARAADISKDRADLIVKTLGPCPDFMAVTYLERGDDPGYLWFKRAMKMAEDD